MSAFHPYASLSNGLLGAWCPSLKPGTGNRLVDISGKGFDAAFVGGGVSWQPRLNGVCVYFNNLTGGQNRAVVSNSFPVQSIRTLSMWVAGPLTIGVANHPVLFSDGTDAGRLLVSYTGGAFAAMASTVGTNSWNASGTSSNAVNGILTHITVLKTGDKITGFFVDGNLRGAPAASGTLSNGVANYIGARFDTAYAHTGWIDDVRVYDRLLTSSEIKLLASRRGIGLTSVRKRPPQLYPITTPPNRLYAKASGLWVPGTPKVNKNGFWASYTPTTATYHADAVDWEARVRANGGTVSVETLQAVSAFCTAIETAGIRSKLYRVNLFCGDNLQACLVPLYTSPTTGSAPVGGYAVDFNTGFLNSDYMEKGIGTGGLRGNGVAAKKLSTNLRPHDISTGAETGHLGMYTPPLRLYTTSAFKLDTPVSAVNGNATNRFLFDWRGTGGLNGLTANWGLNTSATTPVIFSPVAGLILCDRSSTTRLDLYRQGVSVANNTAAQPTYTASSSFEIFSNQMQNYTSNPLFGYTLGSSLTAAEHVAYSAAWNTLQAALSRGV
jgi:hypothetical protein